MYAWRFKYFLFEINKVENSTNRNRPEIIKGTEKEKYQLMPRKLVIKIYEEITANINEKKIIGVNNIKDSNIINLIMFDFSKPRILKTKF